MEGITAMHHLVSYMLREMLHSSQTIQIGLLTVAGKSRSDWKTAMRSIENICGMNGLMRIGIGSSPLSRPKTLRESWDLISIIIR